MINVFKKRTHLYALTTSAFFFLQSVDASVGNNWFSFSSPMLSPFASFYSPSYSSSLPAQLANPVLNLLPTSASNAISDQILSLALDSVKTSISNSVSDGIASIPDSVIATPVNMMRGVASVLEYLEGLLEPSLEEKLSVPIVYVSIKRLPGSQVPLSMLSPRKGIDALCEDSSDDSKHESDSEHESIVCVGGEERTIKGGKVRVKKYGGNAVFAMGRLVVADNAHGLRSGAVRRPFFKTVDIAKATTVKIESVSIVGVNSQGSSIQNATMGFGSAVFSLAGAKVELLGSNIESFVAGLEAGYKGNIHMKGGSIKKTFFGASADVESSIFLEGTDINVEVVHEKVPLDYTVGLRSSGGSQITMRSGAITFARGGVGVLAEDEGFVKLDDVGINIADKKGGDAAASSVSNLSVVFLLKDGFVSANRVTFNSSDAIALWVNNNLGIEDSLFGVINYFDDGLGSDSFPEFVDNIVADGDANISAAISYSNITVEGKGSYGIYFGAPELKEGSLKTNNNQSEEGEGPSARVRRSSAVAESTVGNVESQASFLEKDRAHLVLLRHSVLNVPDSVAIYGKDFNGSVVLGRDTLVSGDLLLHATGSSSLSVFAHESDIIGSARIDENASAKLFLSNSGWRLAKSKYSSESSDTDCIDSCVSSIDIRNSAIAFFRSEGEDRGYQTLRVGDGNGAVYTASGDSYIYFNARLVPNDSENDQMSDRLLIHGDVVGKTIVRVKDTSKGVQQDQNKPHSVSIIQVFGQAEKDSFKLEDDYITREGSPYKYVLRAYSPINSSEMQLFDRKLIANSENANSKNVWDFRLENQYVVSSTVTDTREKGNGDSVTSSVSGESVPEQFVRSVVPQVPTYLVLPNSVFHTGLMDINNQNKQLETLRMTSTGMLKIRKNPALYLRGYGGSYRYASDLSALEYGYDGDLDYRGVEAGMLLQTIENTDHALSFGVMGTYGKLSLRPLDVEQSQKSAFDKWTATVYGSMQHNAGFYVDGLLSYGLFKGDVLTLARGKTATLRANPLSVSLMSGQTIATGYKGFVFDPQVQVVYQHLQFNKARDIDNFDIEMGNLNQWVARVGGCLTKTPTGSESVDAVAFYGKLYLSHGFGEKRSVRFNDAFKLGAFGSSIEAGLGFNAKLLPQFSLHADVLYQHKLNKAGFSGASFSGGVRYQF
ncbi:autotransporter outer membrane beta-barrel domain-containing protein [Bartonella tribocorum]|uniref:Autotransporter outer membrane beta-barrel domain-containing protein n=1 Tax=Bartonella tribocorum TaxID=85701 RepID=A0A2M6URM9_9HYPH|nr:autotransporter outer membrane beta-barrel domain-containing protein [Bartonella tribocorum]PIT68846.1 autotransporter outer membrane beta-barrel domain-containing protein [Bartonella tribocorum]